MNRPLIILAALVSLFALPIAHAARPVGTIGQLSGLVMAVKPDGRPRILSATSRVEVGDTLVSEADSFVRLVLDNGNEAVLGPLTTLKVERFSPQETALTLVGGQLQVSGSARQPAGHRFTLEADGTTVDAGAASFFLTQIPQQQKPALALRRLYTRTSLALATSGVMTDGGDQPLRDALREVIAQNAPNQPRPGGLAPGLYVSVIDGAINLSNKGGSQKFSAGQFGYTANINKPPVIVPSNPGIKFTPPPTFSSNSGPGNNAGNKPAAIDCEVR